MKVLTSIVKDSDIQISKIAGILKLKYFLHSIKALTGYFCFVLEMLQVEMLYDTG